MSGTQTIQPPQAYTHALRFCCKDRALVAGHPREDEMTSQAATWNSPAMNTAWALMSPPLMFRTCPFLIIAIAS